MPFWKLWLTVGNTRKSEITHKGEDVTKVEEYIERAAKKQGVDLHGE
jgi:hypothetical protein